MIVVRDDLSSGLQLQFDVRTLEITPALAELTGPEIALLHFSETEEWEVWRPGEDTFVDLA